MILGISLNSRILGLAVLDQQTLVDYRIRLFKDRWSPEKQESIMECIKSYMVEYRALKAALVLPHLHYRTPETKALIDTIKTHCRNRKLPLRCYKAQALHALCDDVRAKKKALMQALSLLHPELSIAHKKELRNKKRYYNKLFEAVGAATLHAKELEV